MAENSQETYSTISVQHVEPSPPAKKVVQQSRPLYYRPHDHANPKPLLRAEIYSIQKLYGLSQSYPGVPPQNTTMQFLVLQPQCLNNYWAPETLNPKKLNELRIRSLSKPLGVRPEKPRTKLRKP